MMQNRKLLLSLSVVVGTLALFPIPYYLTHISERYRYPIEPIVLLAACWWLERTRTKKA